jgi:hypothetical protein
MAKLALFPLLLIAGCVVSGLYGALHDQISYSVSPDYFHAFKFYQFDIPERLQNRLGAGLVGWLASWWMGVFIGMPVLLAGLIMPDARTYARKSLVAFGVVAATALAFGLGALAYAHFSIDESAVRGYTFPPDVADPVAFARVGTMHAFSYLGGLVGIITAVIYLVVARVRMARGGAG